MDPSTSALSPEEIRRYSRHLLLPEVGLDGQKKIKAASVLLVGVGGLGSPLALYLAAAGIGRLGIVDFDVVDVSNLQRQVIHGTSDIGRSKLDSARDRINDVNPHVRVDLFVDGLNRENALDLIRPYDIVVDGTDNFPTRYLVNDACILEKKPNVYGSIFRFEGQVSVFGAPGGPCYRCLYPEPPPPGLVPSCAEGGVLGILPGIIGTLQAAEVIKLILGAGDSLAGRLLLVDVLTMEFRTLKLRKNPACPVCGASPTLTNLIDYHQFCGLPKPGVTSANGEDDLPSVSVRELKARLERNEDLVLLDVRKPHEYAITNLGGLLIPVDELETRLKDLDPYRSRAIVVHCKSGARSARAVRFLLQEGFPHVQNLTGGLLAWSREIDPSVPEY